SYSIKPERERLRTVSFSEPYLRTTQSVVTRKDTSKEIESLRELRGEAKSVCTLGTATSVTAAVAAGLDDELVERKKIHDCIDGLRDGRYEAVTTDAAILAGWVDKYSDDLQDHDISLTTDEEYGVNTGGKEALRTLVDLALYRTLTDPRDGRWKDAYDKHLRPLQRTNESPVAEAHQPFLTKPPVREMPWDERAEGR
ncbi:MAG: transporter substrate-binding domain-containing protein, partial [Micromonosporaceae bacterium]